MCSIYHRLDQHGKRRYGVEFITLHRKVEWNGGWVWASQGKEPPTAVTSVTMRCLESRCELGALFWPFNSARPFNRRYTHPFIYQYHAPCLRALLTYNFILTFCLPARCW